MRVALISFNFGEYCVRLAGALAEHATMLLLLNDSVGMSFASQLDGRVRHIPFPHIRYRDGFGQIQRNRCILRQLHAFQPDVIHLQQGSMWFNMALTFEHNFPLVLTVHDAQLHPGDKMSRKTPHIFSKMAFHRADWLIVHNNYVKTQLVEEHGVQETKISVIPHIQLGHDVDSGAPADDGRTLLFFGRIWPYKGLEYLIRAEPLLRERLPGLRIVIAGEGENFERYRRLMTNPDSFVVLNRHISDAEATTLFQQASVVVLPYIEASQSGVIPIAYTHSKPVVGTTVGGLPEMIDHGVTGFLVPPADERRLADAIFDVLQDDALRRKMGKAARRKIERECSPAVIARQTLEIYRVML